MSSTQSSEFLFVYGTLKRGIANPWSRRLWAQARFAGCGTLPGKLYDLGPYPAFVEDDGAAAEVHGEVAELDDPAVLEQLDRYEGSQYERVLRQVRMEDGSSRPAWVYVFRRAPLRARLIPEGRWPLE